MPLFGSKKKKTSDMSTGGKGYPTQSQAQQASAYPTQPQASPYNEPPPGYSPAYPQAYPQMPPQPMAPQQPVQVQGVFDQGARFNPGQQVHIPPPPPGVAPTPAQVATQQGQNIVMTQQRRDIWGGGSDGGYSMF